MEHHVPAVQSQTPKRAHKSQHPIRYFEIKEKNIRKGENRKRVG